MDLERRQSANTSSSGAVPSLMKKEDMLGTNVLRYLIERDEKRRQCACLPGIACFKHTPRWVFIAADGAERLRKSIPSPPINNSALVAVHKMLILSHN